MTCCSRECRGGAGLQGLAQRKALGPLMKEAESKAEKRKEQQEAAKAAAK